jgi:hypothetical protein
MKFDNLLNLATPVLSALFIWYIQYRYTKKDDKKQEEINKRAEARKQENLLTMRMIKAVGKLSFANAIALKDGKVNGVMEEALKYYGEASDKMTEFLQDQAVDNFIK